MDRSSFNKIIAKVPHLTAEGLMDVSDPTFLRKRHEFVVRAIHLQHVNDALSYLSRVGKSSRFSKWQRVNCTPERLQPLIEWWSGRTLSPGAIIVAALHLGFSMGVQDGIHVYFNFLSNQIEGDLNHFAHVNKIRLVAMR